MILMFKAALIDIFILTMDQMTRCTVKEVTDSDNLSKNYHLALQFLSVLLSLLASLF